MDRLSPAPTGSTTRRLALAVTLLVALFCTPTASADTGDLSYRGCIGTLAGCGPTNPATALSGATAVAMTPDGDHLYTASSNSVSHFLVDSTGDIAFAGCVGNLIGCTPTAPATALASGSFAGLAISADGRHLYLANSGGVSHLRLDTAGNATFAGCVGSLTGCTTTTPATALSSAVGMALKNGHLYVGSLTDNVSHLTINDTGDLTFAGCAGALSGCASLRVTAAATDPFSLALSPDGGHLYSTSTSGTLGNVAHWTLGATGNLAFVGCIGNRPGCATTTPAGALNGARGLDLSADGKHLYAAANSADAVAWMTLDGVGTPQVRGCVGQSGCTPVTPATALNGALQVSIAPDGSRLYVVSSISDAVSHLRLGSTGAPSFANCSGGLSGCSPIAPATALNGASGVAVRPNGSHLYVAALFASAVSRFSIAPPPPPPTPPATPAPPAPQVVAPAGGIDGDKDGFFAGQDCNDANPAIRPGAVEVRGNRLDENCDGLAEPFPTLASGVVNKWDVKGTRLKLTALQITQQFPKGMKVEISCKGVKCPLKTKTLKAGKVRRGAASVISSLSAKQRRFSAGQTVEVRVSAPNFNTKVARFVLRKDKIPTTQPFCVLPGQTKPQKTCT